MHHVTSTADLMNLASSQEAERELRSSGDGTGSSWMAFHLLHFAVSVGSCLAFMPALRLMAQRRRHFEVFIGVFQLLSAVMYSGCDALGSQRGFFVARDDWHRISDITTETSVCFICIHLYGLRHEDTMIWLRYLAFGGSWLAKLADGWGSVVFETVFLSGFVVPASALAIQGLLFAPGHLKGVFAFFPYPLSSPITAFLDRTLAYDLKVVPYAAASVIVGVVFLAAELRFDVPLRLLNAIAHCFFGLSAYFLWKLLPCYDKSDALPTFR